MDDEQNGYVSIWVGNFTSEEQLHTYLPTVYQGEDETDEAFSQKLAKLFLPENQHRTCEEEFKALYDEFYNQFEYDFGLTFDEDFCEALFYEAASNQLKQLLCDEFSYSQQFKHQVLAKMGNELQKAYNAIILLYDMKYEGHIQSVSHEAFHIDFVCSIKLQEM
ncbi:immunity 22 family protein [Lysinibacillus capsici]|uniref:immunity 22 family protein n=1 Tax=Lysinibacillus capsici TaxID=2115968 RepID=UPI0034E1E933